MANDEEPYLVIGARGMLGRDLVAIAKSSGINTIGLTSDDLDIRAPGAAVETLCAHKPRVVINAAAYTNVDGCESNEEEAFRVNAQGTANLAIAAKKCGTFLVHLSTDYVFNGRKGSPYVEADAVSPLGIYGKSKAEGEAQVAAILPGRHCIIRTQWLFGLHGKNFVEAILTAAQSKDVIKVVNDQWGCPTYTRDLARAVLNLCSLRATGIVHVTNSGKTTWYDFAVSILGRAGVEGVRVDPISTDQLGRPAPRPAYSVLDNSRFRQLTGTTLRHWDEALQEYLGLRESAISIQLLAGT
jgi:dTDP-4-dehydrorhamnose reductase